MRVISSDYSLPGLVSVLKNAVEFLFLRFKIRVQFHKTKTGAVNTAIDGITLVHCKHFVSVFVKQSKLKQLKRV